MFRISVFLAAITLVSGLAVAQQPSGTSSAPAPGTHMNQSTAQTVGTQNGAASPANNAGTPSSTNALLPNANASALTAPMPVTKTLSGGGLADPNDVADLLAPSPLRPSKLSLIGGTVKSIDQIKDHMTVRVYGSGSMKVKFDQRTHFYRDGRETTQMALKRGDRVYIDTQLNQGAVFAKNVHIETGNSPADANGQIVSFNPKSGEMEVHDTLANSFVKFRISPSTAIKSNGANASRAALVPGAIVAVKFSPGARGGSSAQEVSVLAAPGSSFTYFGRVTFLDLRAGAIAIENRSDGKTYEVHFDPATTPVPKDLTVGSDVTVIATFEGTDYLAKSIQVNGAPAAQSTQRQDQ